MHTPGSAVHNFNPRSPCGERHGRWQNVAFNIIISIHAPRVGSDIHSACLSKSIAAFQSTLPVWGATILDIQKPPKRSISIHAPRVGSDGAFSSDPSLWPIFQSTLPVWGATKIDLDTNTLEYNFNPRSPCGERHQQTGVAKDDRKFQSTLPVWGATIEGDASDLGGNISIHAPRVGSDKI